MSLYQLLACIWLLPRAIAWNCDSCELADAHALLQTDLKSNLIPRPNVGKGPDHVTFGMQILNFYGVDIKDNRFTIDLVINLKWMDKRNIHLIPDGASSVTLSQAEAEKSCWMPQVSVTNLRIGKLDVISTGVMLHRTGEVIKVQRVITEIMDNYNVKEYPFDGHSLNAKIASTQYMTGALQLVPDQSPDYTGVPSSLFTGTFRLQNYTLFRVNDDNGLLQKSRGILSMKVQRDMTAYFTMHFLPAMFVVALSCSVFYMPFINMFIMPRLAMSIISYLNFVGLAGKSDAGLPKGHPTTWNEILNQNIEIVLVLTAAFNIYSEIVYHTYKVHSVAESINTQCKVLLPALFIMVITTIMVCGANHMSRGPVDIAVKVGIGVVALIFLLVSENRKKASQERGEIEIDQKGGDAAGGDDGDDGGDAGC